MQNTRKRKSSWTTERIVVHLLLLLFVALALGPILLVIMNSFKTTPAIFMGPFQFPAGKTFSLSGYERVFTRGNIAGMIRRILRLFRPLPLLALSALLWFAWRAGGGRRAAACAPSATGHRRPARPAP